LILAILLSANAACQIDLGFPRDDTRDNLSLIEAQQLTPFVICIPRYVPPGINPEPVIARHAEWDNPDYPEIHLCYGAADDRTSIIHIRERFDPADAPLSLSESERDKGAYKLLSWIVIGWRLPSDVREGERLVRALEQASEQASTRSVVAGGRGGRDYVIYEVLDPPQLRGSMVEWKQAPIHYRLTRALGERKR